MTVRLRPFAAPALVFAVTLTAHLPTLSSLVRQWASDETWHVDGRAVPVNRHGIERGGLRQLAYYWYEGRGRIVANESAVPILASYLP
jgi:hypothetical protein